MATRFERLSLYEEVWSTPLTRLGEKYGLSDNGLRKICKALNIPLPKAGHWAKVAAGHETSRAPLPDKSNKTEYISDPRPVTPVTEEQTEDLAWLAKREEFELDPANKISVDLKPKKFHSMLIETRRLLAEKLKESQRFRNEAEKEANRPAGRRWEHNFNSSMWKILEAKGQVLEFYKRGMPFRFTPNTCDRGLAIANALFFAAKRRGFEIVKEENGNKLCFKLNDGTVYLRMSEKLKDEMRPLRNPSPIDLRMGKDRIKVPTGILRLHLSHCISELEISDADDKPLQDNLNQVFCRIYKLIVRSRAQSREWAESRRQNEIEQRQREEREKIRQESARLHELEMQRRGDLLKEASNWQHSKLICQYIAHVDDALANTGKDVSQDEAYREWRAWALSTARELDPTPQRMNGLGEN